MGFNIGDYAKVTIEGKTYTGILYEAAPDGAPGDGPYFRLQAPGYGKIKFLRADQLSAATPDDFKATAEQFLADAKHQYDEDLANLTPENVIAREAKETAEKKAAMEKMSNQPGGEDTSGDGEESPDA